MIHSNDTVSDDGLDIEFKNMHIVEAPDVLYRSIAFKNCDINWSKLLEFRAPLIGISGCSIEDAPEEKNNLGEILVKMAIISESLPISIIERFKAFPNLDTMIIGNVQIITPQQLKALAEAVPSLMNLHINKVRFDVETLDYIGSLRSFTCNEWEGEGDATNQFQFYMNMINELDPALIDATDSQLI
jgi:hypothetical protein